MDFSQLEVGMNMILVCVYVVVVSSRLRCVAFVSCLSCRCVVSPRGANQGQSVSPAVLLLDVLLATNVKHLYCVIFTHV